jgi:hypothetical protein
MGQILQAALWWLLNALVGGCHPLLRRLRH